MRFALALAGTLAAGAALAHHGWGSYDSQSPITISGPVKSLTFSNPHVHVMVDHQGRSWELTFAPPSRMQARGAAAEVIKVGAPITAYGYPSRAREAEMRAEWVEVGGQRYQLR